MPSCRQAGAEEEEMSEAFEKAFAKFFGTKYDELTVDPEYKFRSGWDAAMLHEHDRATRYFQKLVWNERDIRAFLDWRGQ